MRAKDALSYMFLLLIWIRVIKFALKVADVTDIAFQQMRFGSSQIDR